MSKMPDEIWVINDTNFYHSEPNNDEDETRYIKAPTQEHVKKTTKITHVEKTCKENGKNLTQGKQDALDALDEIIHQIPQSEFIGLEDELKVIRNHITGE